MAVGVREELPLVARRRHRRRNPFPVDKKTLLVVGGVGLIAFFFLRKRKREVLFFRTPRWSDDAAPRFLGDGCYGVKQQAFVDMSFCPPVRKA
jgi:hypothetical protein